jgi:WS/DGAT/MGAT family acyltransferase
MSQTRLSAQDTSFIFGEDQRIPLHAGGLGLVAAGPLRNDEGAIDIERIRSEIGGRLHRVPVFRQKLATVPFDQGRPVWVDDPSFRIENHVQLGALPRPGDHRTLLDLMGRLQQTLLDRNRPLWEIHFIDGLAGRDSVAMIYKIHHAMIDGTAGVEIAKLLYDLSPEVTPVEPPEWEPRSLPSAAEMIAEAMVDRIGWAVSSARTLLGGLRNPIKPARHLLKLASALKTLSGDVDPLPFNARVSSRRAFATAKLALDRVLDLKRAYGVTVNDIVLASITGALRRYCEQQGIDPDELKRVRALVPVDNREAGDTRLGCNVSSMFIDLPVDEPDLHRRVVRIYQRSQRLKELDVAEGANLWARVTSMIPTSLLRATSWFQFRGLMGSASLLVSNVRGPATPFYSLGAEVEEIYPYFGVQDNLGLNIVLVSYNGGLMIGVAADPELVPDLGAFAELLPKAFEELESGGFLVARKPASDLPLRATA